MNNYIEGSETYAQRWQSWAYSPLRRRQPLLKWSKLEPNSSHWKQAILDDEAINVLKQNYFWYPKGMGGEKEETEKLKLSELSNKG